MAQNQQSFWKELPTSEGSLDLLNNEEYGINISSIID